MDTVEEFISVQEKALNIFIKKNQDYGDSFKEYGTVGILIRIQDKLSRYMNITNSGIQLVDDETLRDTLLDLHNYAGMAYMTTHE